EPTTPPTDTPEEPTTPPTDTPEEPTTPPTDTPEEPTTPPTDTPDEPTTPPTDTPDEPTDDPGDTHAINFDKDTLESGTLIVTAEGDPDDDVYVAQYDKEGRLIALVKTRIGVFSVEITESTVRTKAFIWKGIVPKTNVAGLEK
ncbi:MAG: hypothetical protein ACI4TH_04685, partial [Candidatus Ornithomonoglobus sp.]